MSLRYRLHLMFCSLAVTALVAALFCLDVSAQSTISTGSIQETITD